MSQITAWIREIFIFILSITFIEIMLPEGHLAKYVKFIFAILIMAVILSPIGSLMNKL